MGIRWLIEILRDVWIVFTVIVYEITLVSPTRNGRGCGAGITCPGYYHREVI